MKCSPFGLWYLRPLDQLAPAYPQEKVIGVDDEENATLTLWLDSNTSCYVGTPPKLREYACEHCEEWGLAYHWRAAE